MRDTCIRTGVVLIFLALTGLGCEARLDEASEEERLIGVKIYENQRALSALFEEWKALGINTVGKKSTQSGRRRRCPTPASTRFV